MSLFDTVTEQQGQLSPWENAQPWLTNIMNSIGGQDPWESYGGDWVANLNDMQKQGLYGMADFGMGDMQDRGNNMAGMGEDMLGAFGQSQDIYNNIAGMDPVVNQGLDMEQVAMMADNPYMDGMIDANSRDVTRNLYENQMPGIAAYGAGSGNLGSSRRGMQEGIATRGAADRLADVSSSMRGDAYKTGLGLEADRARQNAGLESTGRGQSLNAAGGLSRIGGAGAGLVGQGTDMQRTGLGDSIYAGDRFQQQDQSNINALMQKHYQDQTLPYEQANAGMDVLMDPAKAFGEKNQTDTEKFNGTMDQLKVLFGGGGVVNNFSDMLSGVFGGAGGAGGGGGNAGANAGGDGDWLGDLFGDLFGGVFGGKGDASDGNNTDAGDPTDVNGGVINTGDDGNVDTGTGDVIPPGGVVSGSPIVDPPSGTITPGDVTPGGVSEERQQRRDHIQKKMGKSDAEMADLIASGVNLNEVYADWKKANEAPPPPETNGTQKIVDDLAQQGMSAAQIAAILGDMGIQNPNQLPGGTTGPGGAATGGGGGEGEVFETLWGTEYPKAGSETQERDSAAIELAESLWSENVGGMDGMSMEDGKKMADNVVDAYKDVYDSAMAQGMNNRDAMDQAQYQSMLFSESLGAEVNWGKASAGARDLRDTSIAAEKKWTESSEREKVASSGYVDMEIFDAFMKESGWNLDDGAFGGLNVSGPGEFNMANAFGGQFGMFDSFGNFNNPGNFGVFDGLGAGLGAPLGNMGTFDVAPGRIGGIGGGVNLGDVGGDGM